MRVDDQFRQDNFILNHIRDDLSSGRCGQVVTRFPPEPNGYLHIGHAKAAFLNAGMAREFDGVFRLRFDDTNPARENKEFQQAIVRDLQWLGIEWQGDPRFASDYFEQFYQYARQLVEADLAYVCSLSGEQIRELRGTLTTPGQDSPWRGRSQKENLALLEAMRNGEFADGSHVLRARIDMRSPNINMRDPVLYRIRHSHHQRSGNAWPIYPTYDFAHCLSDAIEGVTHSLCTLEFEDHRPLYNWILKSLKIDSRPQQLEFARLQLEGVVTSKRRLSSLLEEGYVQSWDDPRLPTLAGLRRRGYTPAALADFCQDIGVARANSQISMAQLEHSIRSELESEAERAMAVMRPLQLIIDNWGEDECRELQLPRHPADPARGQRKLYLRRELLIEEDDFAEHPVRGFRRLSPGAAVRLRGACVIRCEAVETDSAGKPTVVHCQADRDSFGCKPDYRIGGVIHWLSAADSRPAELRLCHSLFSSASAEDQQGEPQFNQDSLEICSSARVEPELATAEAGSLRQFERLGYFCCDADSTPELTVWNRTVPLRDSWKKKGGDRSGR